MVPPSTVTTRCLQWCIYFDEDQNEIPKPGRNLNHQKILISMDEINKWKLPKLNFHSHWMISQLAYVVSIFLAAKNSN